MNVAFLEGRDLLVFSAFWTHAIVGTQSFLDE